MPDLAQPPPDRIVDRFHRAVVVDPVPNAIRWLLVLPTTIVAWIAAIVALAVAAAIADWVLLNDTLNHLVRIEYRQGIVGALAAFAWVVSGSVMAPSHRRWVSFILFAAGAWLAYGLLWHWYFPESDSGGYFSHLPFYLTLLGGLVGVAAMWLGGHRSRAAPLTHQPIETEAR